MKLEHMTGPEHPADAAAWALYKAAFRRMSGATQNGRHARWRRTHIMCVLAAADGALCAIAFYWMHRRGTVFGASGRGFEELRGRGIGAALLREIRGIAGEADPRDREAGRREDAAAAAVLRARKGLTLAPFLAGDVAGRSGGDGRLRLGSRRARRDEQAGICAALRIFAGGSMLDCTAGGAKPLCIWKE